MNLMSLIRRFLPFLFAAGMGLLAVFGMRYVMQQDRVKLAEERKKLYADFEQPFDVIVARKDIPEGESITAEMLDRMAIPKKFVQPYAKSRAADFLGMVTRAPIATGEQVLLNKLQKPEDVRALTSLSRITPEGKRAMTIGTDVLTGVGGFVRPGDVVDVLWSFQVPPPGGKKEDGELVTVTLFQEVVVLAVGDQMVGAAQGEPQEANKDYTVTLALTPLEAAYLTYAREQGQVQLSLRSQVDRDGQVNVPPANLTMLMESVLGRSTAPDTAPQRTVEVFKGLERSVVSVQE